MNVYFVYKVLTNRIRALIIAAGYITAWIRTAWLTHVRSAAYELL